MYSGRQEHQRLENSIQVNVRRELLVEGKQWILKILELPVMGGITSKLGPAGFDVDDPIWLDWHDILKRPTQARMHMFLGHDKQVPFEVKLERMQTWAEAVGVYDSLMVDGVTELSSEQAEEMLGNSQFPHLNSVVLDTGSRGLRRLFSHLGFTESDRESRPYIPDWDEFVDVAISGQLVEEWRALKGE